MIESARSLAAGEMVHNIDFQVADCTNLTSASNFKPESYDKVFSNAALH